MKLLKWKLLLAGTAALAFSGTANAQATQNLVVTAYVPNVCIFDTAGPATMDFDLSGVSTATLPFDQATTLSWRCSTGFTTDITIGAGNSGDQENRYLLDGPLALPYNLYTDPTFGTIWGDGAGTTSTVSITGTGMAFVGSTTVFGRIQLADAQAATAGIYTDTVLVTILP